MTRKKFEFEETNAKLFLTHARIHNPKKLKQFAKLAQIETGQLKRESTRASEQKNECCRPDLPLSKKDLPFYT